MDELRKYNLKSAEEKMKPKKTKPKRKKRQPRHDGLHGLIRALHVPVRR